MCMREISEEEKAEMRINSCTELELKKEEEKEKKITEGAVEGQAALLTHSVTCN